MEKEIKDWRDDFTEEENEVIDTLMGNYICSYCRKSVSPDLGQKEIYCPHCEMITEAIPQKNSAK